MAGSWRMRLRKAWAVTHAATVSSGQATSALLFLSQCNSDVLTSNCLLPDTKHLSPGAVPDSPCSVKYTLERPPGPDLPQRDMGETGEAMGREWMLAARIPRD